MASRYYQPSPGHTPIGSFLHERMTGAKSLEPNKRWWCNCGGRQSRHHPPAECRAWAPQIRRLWERVAKDCEWESPRAPAVSLLWDARAVDAVVEFL